MTEQPPPYPQETFLDPSLNFNSQTWREHFEMRDRAFARAIVKLIANYANSKQLFEGCGGYVYRNLKWDAEIGYPAVQAFKTNRTPYIVEQAKLDLTKRGFIVEELELILHNENERHDCRKTVLNCSCPYHGIFVWWKLGLGA